MLVHICCSVDSHFFLQELKKLYPKEDLVGFFYDPNIHPYSEYCLRLLDVKRSCKKLGIRLIEGEYDYENWLEAVRGFENEPERGKRCNLCFDNRLENTAIKAKELGQKTITTTLLTSPKKSMEDLGNSLKQICAKHELNFITPDFRKNSGTSRQFELAKKDMLYHQNYCGCLFALNDQRQSQKRLSDELMSPISAQILPSSIDERIKLYEKVRKWEKKGKDFWLKRESFLNYRLLDAKIKAQGEVLPSYILFYSHMKRTFTRGKIAKEEDGIGYFNRENIIFLSLEKYNNLSKKNYKSVKELIFAPPKLKVDLDVRKKLQDNFFSLSPIIILDALTFHRLEITLNSHIYQDVREILAIKR
ncbi:MAG: diacylglucosamine hydrolase like protein [Proteobacteria bacterium]|nr:MAG: diacylglucosamine hydrolase like protein [Pseudomonadota bacterium]